MFCLQISVNYLKATLKQLVFTTSVLPVIMVAACCLLCLSCLLFRDSVRGFFFINWVFLYLFGQPLLKMHPLQRSVSFSPSSDSLRSTGGWCGSVWHRWLQQHEDLTPWSGGVLVECRVVSALHRWTRRSQWAVTADQR